MISWIQRTFQQHFRIMFLVLLAVVIVTMVFTIGAMPGCGPTTRRGQTVTVFGQPFSSEQERERLATATRISGMLSGGEITTDLYGRAALKQLADKFGVPRPTTAQLTEFIRTRPALQGQDGQFDPQTYARFIDSLKGQMFGFSEAQVEQTLVEDWRLEKIQQSLTGPGFAAERDVQRAFEDRETQWTVQTATLDLTGIQAPGEPTAEELQRWFEASASKYDRAEQIVVDYVEFPSQPHLEAAKSGINDDVIVAYFERNRSRYQKPAEPAADGTPPASTPAALADVRDQVIQDLTQARAAAAAARLASDFAVAVFDAEVVPGTAAFDAFIANQKLTLQSAPPFSRQQPPPGLLNSPAVVNAAFRLNDKYPISNELRAGDSTVILFFRQLVPPTPSPFESVREAVITDVRADKRRQAIVARGEDLRRQLTAAVAAGQTFADAAKAAGLEAKTWEKFKLSAPPSDIDYAVIQNLAANKDREVSQMSIRGEQGAFVFVNGREVPDPTVAGDVYAETRRAVMERAASVAGQVALVEVIRQELVAVGLQKPDDAP